MKFIRNRTVLVLIFGLVLGASQASGSDDIDLVKMMSLQQNADVMHGDFVQSKFLQVFPRPIVSRGRFDFFRDKKLIWRITSPIENTIEVYKGKIVQTDAFGNVRTMAADDQPFVSLLSEFFFAILSGDSDALVEHFEMRQVPMDIGWHLKLTPRSAVFKAAISSLELSGDQTLGHMTLFEVGGDRMEIDFSDVSLKDLEKPCEPE